MGARFCDKSSSVDFVNIFFIVKNRGVFSILREKLPANSSAPSQNLLFRELHCRRKLFLEPT